MQPLEVGRTVEFACNVCGTMNDFIAESFHRELATCRACGCNARFRGIIAALGAEFFPGKGPARSWPARPELCGLGMSDAEVYATVLREKTSYINTFYDRSPSLDIVADVLPYGDLDFVVSTDVLEHVITPVQRAFNGLFRLLKRGGLLVFSVPYTSSDDTVEHFPHLRRFALVDFLGRKVLVNEKADKALEVHDNLVFHGGEGATLEMRVFGRAALLHHLTAAGFVDVREWSEPLLEVGYYWPTSRERPQMHPFLGHIITARRR
jgi:SAM-dependent methyltransferase